MKALVTGAAGFIGSHLCEGLIDAGYDVVAVDAFTDFYPRPVKERNVAGLRQSPRFTLAERPIAEADWLALLDGVSHVFHLAAQAGVRKSWGREFRVYSEQNIEATQILLEACKARPLDRFVFASSSSVYGDRVPLPMREDARLQPVSPYGVTKLAAEHLCLLYHATYGVPTVAVRYFTVYGPRQRPDMGFHRFFLAAMRDRPATVFGSGRQTRDFTYVTDAVAATMAAVHGRPGAVYNIGGGSRVELLEALEHIRRVTGRSLPLDRVETQAGDMRDTYADTTCAQRELGFAPAVALEEGLREQFEWMTRSGLFID